MNQDVTLICKVVQVDEVVNVKKTGGKELKKRDVVVGDETGSCRLVLWEADVDILEEGKSYKLVDVGVRKYGVDKYLSFMSKSSQKLVEDVGDVSEQSIECGETDDFGHVIEGDISAVISENEYLSCKFCRSKAVSEDGVIAECCKCSAMMKVSVCEQMKSAKFVVTDCKDKDREVTLSAFEPVLSRIVGDVSGRSLGVKLLSTSSMIFRFNDRKVVFSIQQIKK